ncbi:MAG: hypothetical protein IPI65_06320 [Bacteroidetes bacterium]|nr:hypothetical protein [Bacteroidota bacterium]
MKGYLGQYEILVADTTSGVELFDQFISGEINFGDINIDLAITNGLGASGTVLINSLGGTNTETGETVFLNCPSVVESTN